jgi:HSP20 family protein
MEDMRAELDSGFQLGPYWRRFLPPGGVTDRMLSAIRQEFRVDIREHEGEVIVVADLPGVEKDDVSLQFLNPRMLEISWNEKVRKGKNLKVTIVRERIYRSMQRLVTLPAVVTEKDTKISFKYGVLEVRLNKTKISPKSHREIEYYFFLFFR